VYWQENGVRRQAWMAEDEVAVLRGRSDKSQDKNAAERFVGDVKSSVSEKDILFMNSFVSVIRTTKEEAAAAAFSRRATESILRQAAPDSPVRPVSPIFYPQGQKIPATRMALTGEIIVRFTSVPTADALLALENNYNLTLVRSITDKAFLYQAASPWQSLETANALQQSGLVEEATPHWYRARATRQSDDPLSGNQWHITNSGQGSGLVGADAGVAPVWSEYRGTSAQVIAIVDDGVEIGHEDLQANINSGLSWDYVLNQADPIGTSGDIHGTACAGVAAARGFNGIGVSGAAPWAGLAGIRLLGAETDVNEALSLSHEKQSIAIYSNSWGPVDDGMRLEGPGPLTLEAIQQGSDSGRGGKGNIYVWAGGNGRQSLDNSNYDGYANLRQTLAIGASTNLGVQSSYSEPGANLLVNAPSSGGTLGITTVDRTGLSGYSSNQYYGSFGGTSAAAPLVAGVIALMLEANPNLTWRDVRWILAHTAERNDPTHSDWSTNGADLWQNHSYGFGRVDAVSAVAMSKAWVGLGNARSVEAMANPSLAVPDNSPTGVTSAVTIPEDITVEFVDITFSAPDHPFWGDLEIILTSPAGTRSVLAQKHNSGASPGYNNWRFGSTRHLGESSRGTWTLEVRDLQAGNSGTFAQWQLEIHGHDGAGNNPARKTLPALMLLLEE
jgi:subtilisin-like proprotein convertase family protein